MSQLRVLVTGGSGFIAGHYILQLLEQGYLVRTTIRSLAKETVAHGVLDDAGMVHGDRLSFVAADLLRDEGWADAVADIADQPSSSGNSTAVRHGAILQRRYCSEVCSSMEAQSACCSAPSDILRTRTVAPFNRGTPLSGSTSRSVTRMLR